MDSEIPQPQDQIAPPAGSDSSAQIGDTPPAHDEQAPPDAAVLVARMVAAGEWPEPELIEQIVQAGDAAVDPLIAVLRTDPRGWPEEAPLDYAIGLLSIIRPPRAIPELIEIVRRYPAELGEAAGIALGFFGPAAFEPLLEVCRDPSVTGYKRTHAIEAEKVAAGSDPALRARLADVLRPLLAQAIERGREEVRLARMKQERQKHDEDAPDFDLEGLGEAEEEADDESAVQESSAAVALGESGTNELETVRHEDSAALRRDDGSSEDENESKLDLHEEISFLVNDLSDLADPAARELIKTAFDEDLVETFIIDKNFVDQQYRDGGEVCRPARDWLSIYQEAYQRHIDYLNRPKAPPPTKQPRHPSGFVEPDETPPPMVQEMIRNVGPRLGRNDPCWCGSGKKYKKCHLGKDL